MFSPRTFSDNTQNIVLYALYFAEQFSCIYSLANLYVGIIFYFFPRDVYLLITCEFSQHAIS